MNKRDVPFFNYKALYEKNASDLIAEISGVLARGAYIMQQELHDFEANLGKYLGVKHVVGVADGTVALTMGLRAAGIVAGDEVILPSHTFVATAAAVAHLGAKPVLAECGRDHLIDPDSIEGLITTKTRVIMPVQLNGRTAQMDRICSIASENGLKIVEDSAQALGSKFKNKFAGTFGVSGSCSFYPSKTLGCFGDGGAVFTDSDEVARYVRLLRDHGREETTGDIVEWGYNARLDNLQAAVLNYKLRSYDQEILRRREIASIYNSILSGLSQLVLPPAPNSSIDHFDIYQNYEIEVDNRDELRGYLETQGIKTILQWGGKMLHQFPNLKLNNQLPLTEELSKRYLLLPMNTSLTDDDVYYVANTIDNFYK
jgi:dTDP-4-amino-4,6-dideoxygalactose transaminase